MSEKHFENNYHHTLKHPFKREGELINKDKRLILTIDTIKSLMTHYRVNKFNIDGSTLFA